MKKAMVSIIILFILTGVLGCQSNQQPVEIVSLRLTGTEAGPNGEINPGGSHVVEMILRNVGREPIDYIRATITISTSVTQPIELTGQVTTEQDEFDANSNVLASNPLMPGESRSGTITISPWISISSDVSYPLHLHVTLQNKTLDYTKQVQIK